MYASTMSHPYQMLSHIRYSGEYNLSAITEPMASESIFGNFSRVNHGGSRTPFKYNFLSIRNLTSDPPYAEDHFP